MPIPIVNIPFDEVTPIVETALTAFKCDEFDKIGIYVDFTKGSLTTGVLEVEFSNDETTWYKMCDVSITAPTGDVNEYDFSFDANGKYRFLLDVVDKYVRLTVNKTGADNTGSAMTVELNMR